MPALRLFGAFAWGVLLYQIVVIDVGGIVAAVAIPRSYFAWFGPTNAELALAVLQAAAFALPRTVLVAGGVLVAHRVLAGNSKAVLLALFAGLAACFTFWVALPGQSLEVPWWAVSGLLGPWAGFGLAAWLVLRKVPRVV